jgi:hypothetical protein
MKAAATSSASARQYTAAAAVGPASTAALANSTPVSASTMG